jgi:transcriptional regulator with XRE-family HTH domain
MKKEEQDEARLLRKQGLSLKEITKKLGVAKSSVSVWTKDIVLTTEQKTQLTAHGVSYSVIEQRRLTRLQNENRRKNLLIEDARKEVKPLTLSDLKYLGAMLYWAEGGKTQGMVRFSNSDPEMIKLMMMFFRQVCEVPEKKFKGYIHIHPHLDHKKAEQYWSLLTGVPLDQFFKTYRIPNKSSKNKKDTLPYGTFDIYICDVKLLLRIFGWIRGVCYHFEA